MWTWLSVDGAIWGGSNERKSRTERVKEQGPERVKQGLRGQRAGGTIFSRSDGRKGRELSLRVGFDEARAFWRWCCEDFTFNVTSMTVADVVYRTAKAHAVKQQHLHIDTMEGLVRKARKSEQTQGGVEPGGTPRPALLPCVQGASGTKAVSVLAPVSRPRAEE